MNLLDVNAFDGIFDDDDDDDFEMLPWGFNNVLIPALIFAGTTIAACVGSAAAYATIYIWLGGAALLGL